MRNFSCLFVILLYAGRFCLGATPEGSPVPEPEPGFALEDSEPNSDHVSADKDGASEKWRPKGWLPVEDAGKGQRSVASFEEIIAEATADTDPNSMLHDAIWKRDLQSIKTALSKGANPNGLDHDVSVLDVALLCYCYDSSDFVNERKQEACLQMLGTLFDAGARLRPTDRFVLFSPIDAGYDKVVEMVLSKGAKADRRLDDGRTCVEVAEANGRRSTVDLLIKHGGKPVRLEGARQLRLLEAARSGRFILMERAIREGASANEPDSTGETPLTALVGKSHYDCERYAMLLFLLKKGADPSKEVGGPLATPLHTAMFRTAVSMNAVRALRYGNTESERNVEELFYARMVLETLLEAGAPVASRNKDGQTPLHLAARWNNLVGAELLLKAGSTVMPRDNAGKTPLDYAESAGMIKLLKDHGATE